MERVNAERAWSGSNGTPSLQMTNSRSVCEGRKNSLEVQLDVSDGGVLVLPIIVLEKGGRTVVQGLAHLALANSGLPVYREQASHNLMHDLTHLLEENRGLTKDMPGLDKLSKALAKQLVAFVHLRKTGFVLRELHIQLVDGLRSTRTDSHERRRVVEGANSDGFLLLLNLRGKEADATGHLVDAADLTDEGTLEGIDVGVQLRASAVENVSAL